MPPEPVFSRLLASVAKQVRITRQSQDIQRSRSGHEFVPSTPRFSRRLLSALADDTRAYSTSVLYSKHPVIAPEPRISTEDIIDFSLRGNGKPVTLKGHGRPSGRRWLSDLAVTVVAAVIIITGTTYFISKLASQRATLDTSQGFEFRGLGFDACSAPAISTMEHWIQSSPYRAIVVYIGGGDRGCAQPHLTASWIRTVRAQGWTVFPEYVGPQASFGEIRSTTAAQQGLAAARDARAQFRALGFPRNVPMMYDMEEFSSTMALRVGHFLGAWDRDLNSHGYYSGVYTDCLSFGSLYSVRGALPNPKPNVFFNALWNKSYTMNMTCVAIPSDNPWANAHINQIQGDTRVTYDGLHLDIDKDVMNIELHHL